MNLSMNATIGNVSLQGGEAYINPILPQSDHIVRAWSLRRLIPEYLNGTAVMADRTDPIGGIPDDGFAVNFKNNGEIIVPAGLSARAYEIHDQKCASDCKLIQGIYAACPEVFSQTEGTRKALRFTKNQTLQMAGTDAALETALSGVAGNGVTISLWVRSSVLEGVCHYVNRRSAGAGYLRIYRAAKTIRIVYRDGNFSNIGNISANTWYHVVIAAKGADKSNGLRYYLNAVTAGAIAIPAVVTVPGTNLLQIGNIPGESSTTGIDQVNDLVFWDRELSAPEVLALFNAQAPYYGVSAK